MKIAQVSFIWTCIFNCYFAAPRPTLGHYCGSSITHSMLITAFLHIRADSDRELRSEVVSLSPDEYLVGFELGTFQFWLQRLNPLVHSPWFRQNIRLFSASPLPKAVYWTNEKIICYSLENITTEIFQCTPAHLSHTFPHTREANIAKIDPQILFWLLKIKLQLLNESARR